MGRHRGSLPVPPYVPRFDEELRANARTVLLVLLVLLCMLGWGFQTMTDGRASAGFRWLGLATVGGGALVGVSYGFYFRPGLLATAPWRRDPLRRRVGVAVRYAWTLVPAAVAVGWLMAKVPR